MKKRTKKLFKIALEQNQSGLNQNWTRPPIVVVLGHVDHGKTSLLDYIRKTSVAKREVGGITQGIGASVLTRDDGSKITFIDTPGHAAFSEMRQRGAKLADVAILVVAATEGVKPQTKEALEYLLATKVPFIVAATKMDLPSSSSDKVRNELTALGVSFEGRGGDVPIIAVSSVSGKGADDLLEMVTLVSALHEIKGPADDDLEAIVVETGKGKMGATATIVVRKGTLRIGDKIVSETSEVKVRGMFDQNKSQVKQIFPGEPALVLGFKETPPVGGLIWKLGEKGAEIQVSTGKKELTLERVKIEGELNLVIKAVSAGPLEAVINNLPEKTNVVASSVGEVIEADVFLAKATGSEVISFGSKTSLSVKKLAENEGVVVKIFDIIYELLEYLDKKLEDKEPEILGRAEVLASFPYEGKKVAGCKIIDGRIAKGDVLSILRKDEELGEVKVVSMRKLKDEIDVAKQGEECGILFTPQLDFNIGDVLESVRKKIKGDQG